MSDEALVAEALARLHKAGPDGGEGVEVMEAQQVPDEDAQSPKKRGRKPKRPEPTFPVEPHVIQIVKKPRTIMNHSYRDFSNVPPELGYEHPTRIEDMSFSQKVHHILSDPSYVSYIAWCDHGRAFKILVPVRLEQSRCLMKYFGNDRYSSFLRMLSNYGFKHITQGRDRNAYYHEFMLRGLPHLTQYMPEPKDARRLIPDPENEPDFYEISRRFPLVGARLASSVSADEAPVGPTMDDRRRGAEALAIADPDRKRPALMSALDPRVPVRGDGRPFPSEPFLHSSSMVPVSGIAALPPSAFQVHLLALQQQQQHQHQHALQQQQQLALQMQRQHHHLQEQQQQQHHHHLQQQLAPPPASSNPDAALSALQAYLLEARRSNRHQGSGRSASHQGPHLGGGGPAY